MVNEVGFDTEPTPAAIVSQVAKTPPPVAADDALDKAPTVQVTGNRQRNKEKGNAPAAPAEHADVGPIVVGSATNSGSGKVVSVPTPAPSSSESASGEGCSDHGRLGRTSNSIEGGASSPGSEFTSEAEVQLVERIDKLWSSYSKKSSSVKQSREELKRVRKSLAEQLHAYKRLLVGTGRDGGWAPFLKARGIPLSTADNYVKRHEGSLDLPETKLPGDELPPTAVEVTQKVKKLAPGLIRFLTTPESVSQFVRELGAALQTPFSAT